MTNADANPPTSCGNSFGAPVGELEDSSSLLANPARLRERLNEDGYLFLRNVLDRGEVAAARTEMCDKLATTGILNPAFPNTEAIFSGSLQPPAGFNLDAFARDLRTGELVEPGARVQLCVCAADGDVELAL